MVCYDHGAIICRHRRIVSSTAREVDLSIVNAKLHIRIPIGDARTSFDQAPMTGTAGDSRQSVILRLYATPRTKTFEPLMALASRLRPSHLVNDVLGHATIDVIS